MNIARGVLVSVSLVLSAVCAAGENFHCDGQPVTVQTQDPGLHRSLCLSASSALLFLDRFGLRPTRTIRILVVERSLAFQGYSAFGTYDGGNDTIQVMSPHAVLNSGQTPMMYGEPLDAEHYRGVVAHEIAHAVVQHNSRVEQISRAAQEYLAHATQLAVLPAPRREAIIRRARVGAWESGDAISEVYMALAPERFAVKSYLHLTMHPSPADFVRLLLGSGWFYVYVR